MNRLYYCPRCGTIRREEEVKEDMYCDFCADIFRKKFIPTEEDYDDFDITGKPHTENGYTKEIYEFMWNKYVDIPSNRKLDRTLFEYRKTRIVYHRDDIFIPPTIPTISCPRCGSTSVSTQKKGFGVGKAAAGVVAAGPVGAVAGAAGANKVYNICQNCGHKWEPGNRGPSCVSTYAPPTTPTTTTSSTPSASNNEIPVEELKKLKELLDMEIITKEDFEAKKKQLLGI